MAQIKNKTKISFEDLEEIQKTDYSIIFLTREEQVIYDFLADGEIFGW